MMTRKKPVTHDLPALRLPKGITLLDIRHLRIAQHPGKALLVDYTLDNMRLHSRNRLRHAATYHFFQQDGHRGYASDYGFGINLREWKPGKTDDYFDPARATLPVTPQNALDFLHKAIRQAAITDDNLVFRQFTVHPDII